MRDFRAQVEQDIVKGMEITAAGIAPKLHEMQNVIVECQVALANLQDKELKIENYLNKLDGERPQEGQKVVSGFESMQLEIGSVRDMVHRLESSAHTATHTVVPSSAVFTEQMRTGLVELHEKVTNHDKNIFEINVNVANVGVYQGEVHGRVRALEEELAKANRRRAAAATFNQGTVNALNLKESFSGGGDGCGCQSGDCGRSSGDGPPNPFVLPPLRSPPGMPGSSHEAGLASLEARFRASINGNNSCHCIHVTELQEAVQKLEKRFNEGKAARDPWFHAARALPRDGDESGDGDEPRRLRSEDDGRPRGSGHLPLHLPGALEAVDFKGKGILDDKLAFQPEYRYDGGKGGVKWKKKLENYIISRAPVLKELLEWAEAEDSNVITRARLREAVGSALAEEQIQKVDGGIWGFLSAALTGGAETIFSGANPLSGIDAWRRIVLHIEYGKESRLEDLRDEVKRAYGKPMKDLEDVKTGVAAYDNLLKEYTDAGGSSPSDQEKKTDLVRILPDKIREHLIWHATDHTIPYSRFRDMILNRQVK